MSTKQTSPAHPQQRLIHEALAKLREVVEEWNEADVATYPEELPSFDEYVAEIRDNLRSIEWRSCQAMHCKTCGSEIVETVNDGAFRDGECNGCEYHRYQTQPELVEALAEAVEYVENVIESGGDDGEGEMIER